MPPFSMVLPIQQKPLSVGSLVNAIGLTTFNIIFIDMKNSPSLALLLALMLLLHEPVIALNWQGTGSVSNEKLAFIWNYIQSNLIVAASRGMMKGFNNGFADALNAEYDQAWNTVTAKFYSANPTYNDLVVYGYAFKNQWMWFNGYKVQAVSGASFSFVVWKDYNCQTWKSLGAGATTADQSTGFSSSQQAAMSQWIMSLPVSQLLDDPWGAAKSLIDYIQGSSSFAVDGGHAQSVIMQQQSAAKSELHARLCVVGQEYYDSFRNYYTGSLVTYEDTTYGRFIVFRTR